jgi:hypothetical protein
VQFFSKNTRDNAIANEGQKKMIELRKGRGFISDKLLVGDGGIFLKLNSRILKSVAIID